MQTLTNIVIFGLILFLAFAVSMLTDRVQKLENKIWTYDLINNIHENNNEKK